MSDPIIGIDLGTTNTVVARVDDAGAAQVLADDGGFKVQPSVVSFHPNGSVVVGAPAKQRRVIDPHNTIHSAKRLIGRAYSSPEVRAVLNRMPFRIEQGENDQPIFSTRAGKFAVPEISAIVLDHVRSIAERRIGTQATRAVVTVPASFTDAQRSATATAGAIAGLTIVRVLNEPTAAALAYGHHRKLNRQIAVYDFGGGTFDVTILALEGEIYRVLGTAGDSFLGGDDIDERLVDHMADLFLKQERIDLRDNHTAMQRLRAVAEQTKIELSRRSRAIIAVDEIAYGKGGRSLDLELEISRDEFVTKIADIVDRTFPVCEEALKLAGSAADELDDVVLVGGTTKMPYVRERVAQVFGMRPRMEVNPDEAVAAGAALQAAALQAVLDGPKARSTARRSVAPPPVPTAPAGARTMLGLDADEEQTLERGWESEEPTAVHAEERRRPTVPGMVSTERSAKPGNFKDTIGPGAAGDTIARITRRGTVPPPIPGARPDTERAAVALASGFQATGGDAITDVRDPAGPPGIELPAPGGGRAFPRPGSEPLQFSSPKVMEEIPAHAAAPATTGAPGAPTVVDVTPHALGIGTIAGYCEALIDRNARIPTEAKKLFSTSHDHQQMVRIRVCQGESRRIDENTLLGDLVLVGLQSRPRGETKIEVTFHIDASGILNVRARDSLTGVEQQTRLELLGAQSPEQVEAARERMRALRG